MSKATIDKMIRFLVIVSLIINFENVYGYQGCTKSITTASGSAVPKDICSGALIFEDNFDNFDLNTWHHEITLAGGGNNEFEWYTNDRRNSYTNGGLLHIKPTFVADEYGEDFLYSGTIDLGADCTNGDNNGCRRTGTPTQILQPVKSARIRTLDSFQFKFGRVEVRAKAPKGDWLWPAVWMLPSKWIYGGWPVSGEIDIQESRGNEELFEGNTNVGSAQATSTLHWGPDPAHNQFMRTHYEKNLAEGYDKNFHNYQVEWTPDYIKFSIDDAEIGRVTPPAGGFWELGELQNSGLPNPWAQGSKMAPFDAEFHLIINLAIGGDFFPDNAVNKNGQKPWVKGSPTAMTDFWKGNQQWKPTWKLDTEDYHLKVDYVRVWAL